SFKPQLVHLHNLHYAAGPAIIRSVKAQGIPLVVTLHNYRLLCPSATLFHQGQLYLTGAAQQFPWDAIRKKVHAQSSLKTAWIACTTGLHRAIGTWKMVDRYLALTDF